MLGHVARGNTGVGEWQLYILLFCLPGTTCTREHFKYIFRIFCLQKNKIILKLFCLFLLQLLFFYFCFSLYCCNLQLLFFFWFSFSAFLWRARCVPFGASVKTRLLLFALKNFELQYLDLVLIAREGARCGAGGLPRKLLAAQCPCAVRGSLAHLATWLPGDSATSPQRRSTSSTYSIDIQIY